MDQVKERPLSFQQATRTNPDELRRKRRLEFEIVSWDSEGASVEAYTPWVAANGGDQKGPTVHVSSLTPSVIVSQHCLWVDACKCAQNALPFRCQTSREGLRPASSRRQRGQSSRECPKQSSREEREHHLSSQPVVKPQRLSLT